MCGIAGHLSKALGATEASASTDGTAAVRRMNTALAHRGPDAEGLWSRGPIVLGFRRLSIIDLRPEANQPLVSEDGAIGVVVNGEIYNHEALRKDLVQRGHSFRSQSDSEVVVHLYEEHGADCIARLDGMFAIAVWDSRVRRLLLARDRSGKKPLFYRRLADGGFAFASEVHALLRGFPEAPVTPNLDAIDEYLTLQYVPSPLTAYREIHKLEAAHLAILEPGKELVTRRYWEKPRGPALSGDATELAGELRRLLEAAVDKRLVADVPLGAFLSGGLDSSAIVALMATRTDRPVKTFSIGFPDASDSELGWARMIAARYGTDHREEIVSPEMSDVVRQAVRHHGEPFGDSSAIATYYLAQMTKKHVTVALSGDAGDETFAGYTRYTTARLAHVHDALPARLQPAYRAGLGAVARAIAPHAAGFAEHMGEGEAVRYPYIMCQFTPEEKRALYGPAMRAVRGAGHGAANGQSGTVLRFGQVLASSGRSSALGRLIDLDWQTYLVDDINVKVDIASMAHGLEVRCPFQDTAVVEFAARLPDRMLARVRGKRLLRRAVADLVPKAILNRHKRGFALPLRRWMSDDLGPMVRDVLLDQTARERGLFEPGYVARLIGRMRTDREAPDRVWTLLVLELWFREFIDGR